MCKMGLPMRKIHFESSPIGAGAIVGQQHTLACSCWGCSLGAAVPPWLDNKVQVLVLLAAAAAAGGLAWRPPCQPGAEAMAQPVRQRSGAAAMLATALTGASSSGSAASPRSQRPAAIKIQFLYSALNQQDMKHSFCSPELHGVRNLCFVPQHCSQSTQQQENCICMLPCPFI